MHLVIVESPTKARTLSKFFSSDYKIQATMGHIRDLPKAAIGVDIDHGFVPKYVIPKDRVKTVSDLKTQAETADSIILATDPDREGEAIAWHTQSVLIDAISDIKKQKIKLSRITFHEITESAVKEALKNPRQVDMQLVDAQQARRVLDRLVGYNLSPLLWQKLSKRWLSAGRVQSIAVRFIVEREREIKKFQAKKFFNLDSTFISEQSSSSINAQLVSKNNVLYEITDSYTLFDGVYTVTASTIASKDQADEITQDFKPPFIVSSIEKKQITRNPFPPYTTSTLQQDAGSKLYFSSKKTMQLAQHLYEQGLITYHRTDSVNLSDKFINELRNYIKQNYGDRYITAVPRIYKTKSKVAQEAHEAIRPTDLFLKIENLPRRHSGTGESGGLHKDHVRLYELIWKRAIACQAASAIFDSTTVSITSANFYRFQTQGSVIVFDGYLAILGRSNDEKVIPKVTEGEVLKLEKTVSNEHETKPPPRYTEARLVKTLEEKGIGRPSTYAPTVSTIQDRQYVTKEDKSLVPTSLGDDVTDFLVRYFPDIMDPPFTANLEDKLDAIANGEEKWPPVIEKFYRPFAQTLAKTLKEADKVKSQEEMLDEKCPECGSPLAIKIGRFGKFVACTGFPKCKYTRQFAETIDMKCPKCGSDIVVKKTRRGKTFYGCGNYPTCTFAAWRKEDIK